MSRKTTKIKVAPSNDFIQQIRSEVKYINRHENFSDVGKGFVIWVLRNYFDLDEQSATVCLIDSPNDKRIDAFIEEDETIKIVQCKFFDKVTKEIGSNEIALFKGCLDWLRRPEEVKKLNITRFYDAALTFSERWSEGADVQLHYFVFGKFSKQAEHERIVFNNSDLRERVQMFFHDINDILILFRSEAEKENPLANEIISLQLMPGQYFIKNENIPSIVATIKGRDLLKMFKKYSYSLFERNIRFYRGARKESINAKIIETVLDNKERIKFWYYNNGISFVCRKFDVKGTVKSPILEVKGFQIINGCQTTVCLYEAQQQKQDWVDIPEEVTVVARFIESPVEEVDRITLYTNSQNPVSEIQLKSNCEIQNRLKDDLAQYLPSYFYLIKEGDWQKMPINEKKKFKGGIIEMSLVAQAIYSFTTDPAFARRWKNKLFSEKYNELFRKDITIEELLLPWRMLKVIDGKISAFRRGEFHKLKNEPGNFSKEKREEILAKEFLLYSNLIMLYFIGKLMRKQYKDYSPTIAKKLLNKQLEGRIDKLFDYIVSILRFSDKLGKETNKNRFLKNYENISLLYDEIQKALEMEAARTKKDPLKEMLPQI